MTEQAGDEKALFLAALEKTTPRERRAFLEGACAGDPDLLGRIEELLATHEQSRGPLDSPPPGIGVSPTIDQPITEKPGAVIGPYKLLQQIGEGGMGVVYMAEQTEPVQRRVALKIIKPGMDTRQVIARFEAERQALAVMDHPNIARVFDAGTTEESSRHTPCAVAVDGTRSVPTTFGRPYFVMELVKGVPITEYCDEHHLTPRQRLELFVPVCQAVQHAHQKGIIHRDIKPSNVLVAEYDDRPVPKIIDFGVAKAIEQRLTERTMFTQLGQVVGTIDYMSPEQAKLNQLDIDTRSDIYSLGVLLYELLTGETPFDRERLRAAAFDELLRIIREEEPPRPSIRLSSSHSLPSIAANRQIEPKKLSTLVRGELDWIVMKALEKDRTGRYETANGFAQDIERYLSDEPVQACPPSAVYRFKKFARRNKAVLSVAGLILFFLVLLGSSIGWTVRDRVARQARVSEQVELILDEVGRFEHEQKWPEALAAARRAEPLLAGGEAPEDLQARVGRVVADLGMVERLEEVRLLTSEVKEEGFDYEGANRHYAAAFQQYGVDVDALPADEAAAWLRSRAGVLPALIVALDEWARCRRAVKDEAGAKTLSGLAQALDADPWRRRLREALAAKNEKSLEELAGLEEVVRQAPSTVELVARALEKSGRPERALDVLGRALGEHPDDFWLHFAAAHASSSSRPRRDDEAVRHYTVARALRPRSVAVLNNLGLALRDQGKPDEAMACYRKAIELDPKYALAHLNLGMAFAHQGKLDEAIACYRKAIELDPNYALAHIGLGKLLNDEAIASYRKAIEVDPKSAMAHNNLGNALADQGKLEEAIASYRNAIEVDPKCALAHTCLGNALANQGKLDEAIACYRKAVEVDPKCALAHTCLGNVLSSQGKWDEAVACHRKAIELDPKSSLAHNNLAWCLATAEDTKVRNPKGAIELARKAVQLDPTPWHNWSTLSLAAYRAGDWRSSLDVRQEKLQRCPFAAEDGFFLAMTHWQLGNQAEARKWYDQAIAEIATKKAPGAWLRNLRQEADQLLGITTSPAPPEDGKPQPEKPPAAKEKTEEKPKAESGKRK